MSLQAIYNTSGQTMVTQSIRLGVTAETLSFAEVPASSEEDVFRPGRVSLVSRASSSRLDGKRLHSFGAVVAGIYKDKAPPLIRYEPDHPMANEEGKVFYPNVSVMREMAAVMSASRSFDSAVTVFSAGRQMQEKVLGLMKS